MEGVFVERLNRFAALVEINGQLEMIHVANSGRMRELFVPGYRMLLKPRPGAHRKTKYDLARVDRGCGLAAADARLPNALVREALDGGRLPQFAGYPQVRPESTFGDSRLDFLLEGPAGKCYLETKSVTLVEDGVGLFPDAPTSRGVKHLKSLEHALAYRCRVTERLVELAEQLPIRLAPLPRPDNPDSPNAPEAAHETG